MRTIAATIGVMGFAASSAFADVVAPENVVFDDYGAIEASLSGTPGDAASGRKIFSSRSAGNCVACHMVTELSGDADFMGNVGPTLDGIADRWNEAEIRGIVANAKNIYDGTIMPSFYKTSGYIRPGEAYTAKPATEPLPPLLSAQEIEDVVAYLVTLKE